MRVPAYTYSGGILSRGLWGRVDLNKYQTGLKYAENMIIEVEGGVAKRFGTYFVGERKHADKPSKLIPWRIADNDSYMLEFADNCIRFIRFGGYVTIPSGHVPHADSDAVNVSGFMEVPTPWGAEDVWDIKFTFANDVMYLFHKDGIRQLRRLGLYDWEIKTIDFNPHPAWTGGGTATWHNGLTGTDNYVPQAQTIRYKISATLASGIETKPSAPITVSSDLGHQRLWNDISWSAVPDAVQYTVYKGKNGIYGFIGYTTGLSYRDTNFAPSYDVVPVGEPLAMGGENPRVGEFYKQRMAYAATESEPQTVWFSRPFIFDSLTKSLPLQDDDAIKMPMVGRERHTINHMVQLKKFIIFTDAAEWVMATADNGALTTASANPVMETFYGSNPRLRPIPVGSRILFVQNKNNAVRDMGYAFEADAYQADDLSRLARDIFKDKKIIAWDYSSQPQNILPCVLDDGTLNILTYVREHEIWGWSQANTKGKFLDVACVAEVSQDAVYFQVERTIGGVKKYFIERMEFSTTDNLADMVYLDCALTYKDPYEFDLGTSTISEFTFSVPDHSFSLNDEVQIEIEKTCFRGKVIEVDGDVVTLSPIRQSEFPLIEGPGVAYICTQTITGLEHLEGADVWVLADGKVIKQLTPAVGQLTLPFAAARAHIGLGYTAMVETLDIDDQRVAGLYTFRAVNEIVLNLRQSRGVWAGASESPRDLVVIEPRNQENMYDANDPLDGPYIIPAHAAWSMTCGVRVESRDPLPLNILNIVPDLVYGS